MSFTPEQDQIESAQIGQNLLRADLAKFDKYLVSQLMVLFGFFSLVLVMIYWINRAVILFDQLIANGHSAMVFLEFSALTIPNVVRVVVPISAFAASLYCANRLAADSELVVVQSTGYSPFRLARPVLVFGILVGVMFSILAHFLVPASLAQLKTRQNEISANASARLLREGSFFHPAEGITFYIAQIDPNGTLRDVFLDDQRNPDKRISYSAKVSRLEPGVEGALLVMIDGMAQNLNVADQSLATTRFQELVFDLGPFFKAGGQKRLQPSEIATSRLLRPTEKLVESTRSTPAKLMQEGHSRIAQALFCVISPLIGFSAILMGGFSRFSLWRQVAAAVVILVVIKVADNLLNDIARQNASLWPAIYLSSVLGAILATVMLWISARPAMFSSRKWPAES